MSHPAIVALALLLIFGLQGTMVFAYAKSRIDFGD
jgi:hypothetical protein